jgi:hypothetical protein
MMVSERPYSLQETIAIALYFIKSIIVNGLRFLYLIERKKKTVVPRGLVFHGKYGRERAALYFRQSWQWSCMLYQSMVGSLYFQKTVLVSSLAFYRIGGEKRKRKGKKKSKRKEKTMSGLVFHRKQW